MTKPAATMPRSEPETDRYADLYANFRWQVPRWFNIAEVCCARWAQRTPDATAVLVDRCDGGVDACRFADLQAQANRLSRVLARLG